MADWKRCNQCGQQYEAKHGRKACTRCGATIGQHTIPAQAS